MGGNDSIRLMRLYFLRVLLLSNAELLMVQL